MATIRIWFQYVRSDNFKRNQKSVLFFICRQYSRGSKFSCLVSYFVYHHPSNQVNTVYGGQGMALSFYRVLLCKFGVAFVAAFKDRHFMYKTWESVVLRCEQNEDNSWSCHEIFIWRFPLYNILYFIVQYCSRRDVLVAVLNLRFLNLLLPFCSLIKVPNTAIRQRREVVLDYGSKSKRLRKEILKVFVD
jgi:hypothetical protein